MILFLVLSLNVRGHWTRATLDPCEDIGAIIKQRVDAKMVGERSQGRYDRETLMRVMTDVLESMEYSPIYLRIDCYLIGAV